MVDFADEDAHALRGAFFAPAKGDLLEASPDLAYEPFGT